MDHESSLPDAGDMNEKFLEQTAMTFAAEGISKDLKYFLQKRVSQNRTTLSYVTKLVDLCLESGVQDGKEMAFNKKGPIQDLFRHVIKEIKMTDAFLDQLIDGLIESEKEVAEKESE